MQSPLQNLGLPAGVAPGFNPLHPAAQNTRFSGVSRGSGFVDLMTGRAGTILGAPVANLDGIMGPATQYTVTTDGASFSAKPATVDASFTAAAILNFVTVPSTGTIFCNSTTAAGVELAIQNSVWAAIWRGVTNTALSTAFAPVVGRNYFVAVSTSTAARTHFVVTTLNTGSILTLSTSTIATPSASNGSYEVGNRGSAALPSNSRVAAAMFSAQYSSPSTLRQWASDPWSFWYPGVTGSA